MGAGSVPSGIEHLHPLDDVPVGPLPPADPPEVVEALMPAALLLAPEPVAAVAVAVVGVPMPTEIVAQ